MSHLIHPVWNDPHSEISWLIQKRSTEEQSERSKMTEGWTRGGADEARHHLNLRFPPGRKDPQQQCDESQKKSAEVTRLTKGWTRGGADEARYHLNLRFPPEGKDPQQQCDESQKEIH